MAVDLMPSRRPFCHAMGAEKVVILGEQSLADEVRAWTDGYGVDAAVICTATQSNTPIEQAARRCAIVRDLSSLATPAPSSPGEFLRERTGGALFAFVWTGPLRSELRMGGADYPIGYVRWTSNGTSRRAST